MSASSLSSSADAAPPVSKLALWSGRAISGLVVLALLTGAGMNLSGNEEAAKGAAKLGSPPETLFGIGIAALISAVLYAIPMTRVLGAILLTGYLGGAVATHVRAGEGWGAAVPAFIAGALVWLGLLLRDRRIRELLPLTKA